MELLKKDIRNSLWGGIILCMLTLLIFLLEYYTCKGAPRLDCLFIFLLIPSPGVFLDNLFNLNLEGFPLYLITFIMWFLIGIILGFVVGKFQEKKPLKKPK